MWLPYAGFDCSQTRRKLAYAQLPQMQARCRELACLPNARIQASMAICTSADRLRLPL